MILIGAVLLVVGALSATTWVDAQTDRPMFGLAFFSKVLGPVLGGAIILLMGLMEF